MKGREPEKPEALSPHFAVTKSTAKRARNVLDVFWTKSLNIPMNNYDSWNEILPNLYLGIIPSKEEAIEIRKKIRNLGLVVSAVESFEFVGRQTAEDWDLANIAHHEVPIEDYTIDVDPENVFHAIMIIHDYLSRGLAVYVHCKAGKSRSATIVAAYILIHACGDNKPFPENTSMEEIRIYMLFRRRQLLINENHFAIARQTKEFYQQNHLIPTTYVKDDTLSPLANFNLFFASKLTKREISNLLSFKKIKHYAYVKNADARFRFIDDFLKTIAQAEDAKWYVDLLSDKSKLHELKNLQPHGKFLGSLGLGKPSERILLITSFMTEMEALVRKRLGYPQEELLQLTNPEQQSLSSFSMRCLSNSSDE